MDHKKIMELLLTPSVSEQVFIKFFHEHNRKMTMDEADQVYQKCGVDVFPYNYFGKRSVRSLKKYETLLRGDEFFFQEYDIFLVKHAMCSPENWHRHTFLEMCYVLQGSCRNLVRAKGRRAKEVYMKDGDFLLLAPEQEHCMIVEEDCCVVNIGIKEHSFRHIFLEELPVDPVLRYYFNRILIHDENEGYLLFCTGKKQPLLPSLLDLAKVYIQRGPFSSVLIHHQMIVILLMMIQNVQNNGAEEYHMSHSEEALIAEVFQYIQTNYRTCNVKTVADYCGYSADHLSRVTKKYSGMTVKTIITRTKLEHVLQLLRSSPCSIQEIAERTGYHNANNLIRAFVSVYGCTPGQLRKKCPMSGDFI